MDSEMAAARFGLLPPFHRDNQPEVRYETPSHRSLSYPQGTVLLRPAPRIANSADTGCQFNVLKIRITRGYRERRSPAEMRKLLNRKIIEQDTRQKLWNL
jgi:hypothetical protein